MRYKNILIMGNRKVFSKYKLLYVLRNPGSLGEMKRVLIRRLAEKDGEVPDLYKIFGICYTFPVTIFKKSCLVLLKQAASSTLL